MKLHHSLTQTNTPFSGPTTPACHNDSSGGVGSFPAGHAVRFAPALFPRASRRLQLVLLLIVLFAGPPGFATVRRVPGDYSTITEALEAADDGDTVLVAADTYSEPKESFPLRLEKAITLKGDCGAKPHLKGNGEDTVVLIATGGVTLQCFRITDGSGSEGINKMDGGGICVFVGSSESSDVNIVDCVIENNTCPSDETYDGCGGGIYCGGTYCTCFRIHISNCIIRENFVHGKGGGICCALLSNVDVNETLIENNTADDHGGGVYVDVFATLDINHTHLVWNNCPGDSRLGWGGKGGGLACEDFGVFTVKDSLFEQNEARYFGGAIFTRGALFAGEHVCGGTGRFPYVSHSLIRSNRAKVSGGGVYVAGTGILRFLSTTLYRNDATYDGGGVFVAGGSIIGGEVHFVDCNDCNDCDPYFTDCDDCNDCKPYFADCNDCNNCKLEGNECGRSGGGVYLGPHALGTFGSTRFLGNSALFDGGAMFLKNEANAVLTNCLVTYNNSARGYAGGIRVTGLSYLDLDHCSVVGNFAPHKRSGIYLDTNAIVHIGDSILWRNAGGSVEANGAVVNIATSLNEDGPDPNNGVICCDPKYGGWGALNAIYVDASSSCPGIGTPGTPYCDLQHALDGFNFSLAKYPKSPCVGTASDGGNMGADTGVGGLAGNITAALHMSEGEYDIRGRSIICIRDINGAGSPGTSITNAVFGHIEDSNIMDLSITAEEIFGGIVLRADANFLNCDIHNNKANADGGGIYLAEGHCAMMQSSVSGNGAAGKGGGVYAFADTATSVVNSNIEWNSGGAGGGLYLDVNTVSIVVSDSYVSYNGAGAGGGIHVSAQLQVADSNFIQNGAGSGGGIYVNTTADVNVIHSRFYRNNYNWSGSTGGGLTCLGRTEVEESIFEGNEAKYGGAIRIDVPGTLNCQKCPFIKNKARWQGDGGALYMTANTDPCFVECHFEENWAKLNGGVGMCYDSRATFDQCTFIRNTAEDRNGGCFYLSSTQTQFHNCEFIGKGNINNPDAEWEGGVGFLCNNDVSLFEDCNIAGTIVRRSGGAFCIQDSAEPNFVRVQIADCSATNPNVDDYPPKGGGVAIFTVAEPNFVDVIITNCQAVWGGGVYASASSNSTFRQCEFWNNLAYDLTHPGDGGGTYFTEKAMGTFTGCVFRNNHSEDDGGGMAVAELADVDLHNTLFADNNAMDDGAGIHFMSKAKGTLTNCTLASNNSINGRTGAGIFLMSENTVTVNSSIIWGNNPDGIRSEADPNVSYSCAQMLWSGPGNIVEDPCFAGSGDFHLKSRAGRFDPSLGLPPSDPAAWVKDGVTSPCIDAGDPTLPVGHEPTPNGGMINMGAYGGTAEASKSIRSPGDLNLDGSVDVKDLEILCRAWLTDGLSTRADITRDGIVNCRDYNWLAADWLHKDPAPYSAACWKLDETEGTVAHDECGDNDANLYGPLWTDGKINGALQFDGLDDYMDCGRNPEFASEQMTLSMWIKPDDMRSCHIVSRGRTIPLQNDYFLMQLPNGKLQFFVQQPSGTASVLSEAIAPLNEWSHVAVSLDGSTLTMAVYIGGEKTTATYSGRVASQGHRLVIGAYHPGDKSFYFGKVDDIYFYNEAVKPW